MRVLSRKSPAGDAARLVVRVFIVVAAGSVCAIPFMLAGRIARAIGVTGNGVMTRLLGVPPAALAVRYAVDRAKAVFG